MNNALDQPATADSPLADLVGKLQRGEATPPPIADLVGFYPLSVEPGRAVFELEVDPARHANPMGTKTDRKSTRLNSSHQIISYAVFCLKKKRDSRPQRRCHCSAQRV